MLWRKVKSFFHLRRRNEHFTQLKSCPLLLSLNQARLTWRLCLFIDRCGWPKYFIWRILCFWRVLWESNSDSWWLFNFIEFVPAALNNSTSKFGGQKLLSWRFWDKQGTNLWKFTRWIFLVSGCIKKYDVQTHSCTLALKLFHYLPCIHENLRNLYSTLPWCTICTFY